MRLGGIGIFIGFLIGILVVNIFINTNEAFKIIFEQKFSLIFGVSGFLLLGLIDDVRKDIYLSKFKQIRQINLKMNESKISPSKAEKFGIKIAKDGILRSSSEVLTQKGVNMSKIREIWSDIPFFSKEIDEQVEINAHYRGYLKKQKADILAFKRDENLIIPDKINYDGLSGLSNEVKAKFKEIKPKTMGQALRIDGITPAAVYILLSHVKRKSIKHIA